LLKTSGVSNKISRKYFLRYLAWMVTLPFAFLAGHAIERHNQLAGNKILRISSQLNNGINFLEDCILIKSADDLLILTSRCTHLGCRISSAENGELVCPCHGSRFDLNGSVVKGPASSSLKPLDYMIDKESGEIVINI
jgi:cytochrome b6-f complex iron-sulfur subunit